MEVLSVDKYTGKYPDPNAVNIKFTANKETPSFFIDALKKKKPILIEFYGEGDAISDNMVQPLIELHTKYGDKIVFIELDADKPQTYGTLSEQLPVQYVPQIFIFNKDSTIIRSFAGYVDKERLDQALYDAVNRGY